MGIDVRLDRGSSLQVHQVDPLAEHATVDGDGRNSDLRSRVDNGGHVLPGPAGHTSKILGDADLPAADCHADSDVGVFGVFDIGAMSRATEPSVHNFPGDCIRVRQVLPLSFPDILAKQAGNQAAVMHGDSFGGPSAVRVDMLEEAAREHVRTVSAGRLTQSGIRHKRAAGANLVGEIDDSGFDLLDGRFGGRRMAFGSRHTTGMPGYDDELAQIVAELNRTAAGTRSPRVETAQSTATLDQLLKYAVRQNASDVLLIAGAPVTLRVNGALTAGAGPVLSGEDTRNLLLPLLNVAQYQELQQNKSADLCFAREGIGRFRANVHHQRGTVAGSVRLLPEKIPTLESLHLPATLRRMTEARQGLVLITGPTGCGKSSTLAAMVDLINTQRHVHIVTIEDPVEYVHANRNSIVEQIEVGHDAPEFASSLRSILRQTPDVILVGEMRDPETIATVLTAAETGHLVLSTLHTNDTSQAVSRILDSFPAGNQPQIRQQLSLALLAIVAQQLLPAADGGGRYPAAEIMMGTHAVRNLIRRGDDHQLYTAIGTGRSEGMITMEQSLAEMVRSGRIARDTALAHCFRSEDLRRYLQE